MKVELDLSTEQLAELDKGLVDLISSLTDEQKSQIVKEYLQNKMDNNFYKKSDGYYSSSTTLSDFGREVIDGLQSKISKNITDSLLQDEEISKRIDDVTKGIVKNLDTIISKSLVEYITNNLFHNQQSIQQQIFMTVNKMLNERSIR